VKTSKIEWTDVVWNPGRGCSRVSEGCRNCYAERQAARFARPGHGSTPDMDAEDGGPFDGFVRDGKWTGRVELIESKLREPLSWRKPRRVFVNSMSDLFHESLPDEAIDRVLAIVARCPQHTFQVLTKRPARMQAYFERIAQRPGAAKLAVAIVREFSGDHTRRTQDIVESLARGSCDALPLPNLWLGTSIEDQSSADDRIPQLLATPAAVRFVSAEPLLGRVNFNPVFLRAEPSTAFASGLVTSDMPAWTRLGSKALDWVIVGGESGPGARPCDVAWLRSIVKQCKATRVPVFVKQLGAVPVGEPWTKANSSWVQMDNHPARRRHLVLASARGGDPSEWPEDLRVREFPGGVA
jgi:protein gp37